MILAPFCDCMLSRFDERPAFIVTANAEGAGKTLLVPMAICPVFGPAKLTPPPHIDSDKLTELLNSIAQSGAPYVVFDNWRGKIENAALEAFVTANQMGGRILGTSYTFDVEKQCIVFITGNQAIVGSDMRRRWLSRQPRRMGTADGSCCQAVKLGSMPRRFTLQKSILTPTLAVRQHRPALSSLGHSQSST